MVLAERKLEQITLLSEDSRTPDTEVPRAALHSVCGVFVLFFYFNFYWSIVDLQCYVSFRCTAK